MLVEVDQEIDDYGSDDDDFNESCVYTLVSARVLLGWYNEFKTFGGAFKEDMRGAPKVLNSLYQPNKTLAETPIE